MSQNQIEKKLMVFELNEFNDHLLREATECFDLPNLRWIISQKKISTLTLDTYESDWLEPWVQWVSVHTGQSSKEHQIKHLGSVPSLKSPQIWEVLSQKGVTSGVWGALNAQKGNADKCRFFVPDPWTFSEKGHPKSLAEVVALPRYLAQNRTEFSIFRTLRSGIKTLFSFNFSSLVHTSKDLLLLFRTLWAFRFSYSGCFLVFEFMSFQLFRWHSLQSKPQLNIFFMNSIAHLQHYYWTSAWKTDPRFRCSYQIVDQVIAHIRKMNFSDVIVFNSLSQESTAHERTWVLYRIENLERFLNFALVPYRAVQALMSYDATLFFSSVADLKRAKEILETANIHGDPLFLCEKEDISNMSLFFRLNFFDELPLKEKFEINHQSYPFFEWFTKIAVRTAKHMPQGTIYSTRALDKINENHQLFHFLNHYFD